MTTNNTKAGQSLDLIRTPPSLYTFAAYLGYRHQCRYLIDVGGRTAGGLSALPPLFQLVAVADGPTLALYRERHRATKCVEHDFTKPGRPALSPDLLRQSVVVCGEQPARSGELEHLLGALAGWLEHAPLCVLSVGEEGGALGLDGLERLLSDRGLSVAFKGRAAGSGGGAEKNQLVAVLEKKRPERAVPPDFSVVAVMCVFNEEDVVVKAVEDLVAQGVGVYLMDNWSTDGTYEAGEMLLGRGLLRGFEKFPADGPPATYSQGHILRRKEELARQLGADWYISHDADEIRRSPWPGVSLREGLYRVDQDGFNCVDNTIVEFPPTDDDFAAGVHPEEHFKYFEFGQHYSDYIRLNVWKHLGREVDLAVSGGHSVQFAGRRVYPYKFLTKHYPVRSQRHGEKKVLRERKGRFHPEELAKGWHTHYDHIKVDQNFLRDPAGLKPFDEGSFAEEYVVERLTGIGALWGRAAGGE